MKDQFYLAVQFLYSAQYPPELVDRAQAILLPFLQRWGIETFTSLKQQLDTHPTDKTTAMIQGVSTPLTHEGEPLFAMFAMKYGRGNAQPEFVCFVAPLEKINAEHDRIVAEVQSKSIDPKFRATIAEVRL
jgi:hypothetical protein